MTNETTAPEMVQRLRAFAHDYPCIHCGSPVLKINSRRQIICLRCLGENPSDEKGQVMAEAADALEAAQARIAELEAQDHEQFKKSFDRGVQLGLAEAANLAFEYPADKHGNLDSDPFKAARQAVLEVGLAIEARAALEGKG